MSVPIRRKSVPPITRSYITGNPYDLCIGMVFESDDRARAFVNTHAINNNFAVKNGVVKHKDQTLLLVCKCSRKPLNTGNLPLEVGTKGDNGLTRHKFARSLLCDCPWRVRFQKQLNDSWILTELIDQHDGHQLDGINPYAYPENRSLKAVARATMFDLVQHSSASLRTIASVLNSTYGSSLLGRDVYNRTYDYYRENKSSTARFIETLRDEGYIYGVKVSMGNTLEALFFASLMMSNLIEWLVVAKGIDVAVLQRY